MKWECGKGELQTVRRTDTERISYLINETSSEKKPKGMTGRVKNSKAAWRLLHTPDQDHEQVHVLHSTPTTGGTSCKVEPVDSRC